MCVFITLKPEMIDRAINCSGNQLIDIFEVKKVQNFLQDLQLYLNSLGFKL